MYVIGHIVCALQVGRVAALSLSSNFHIAPAFILLGSVRTLGLTSSDSWGHALSLAEGLQFIRVQTTGGTSFGEHVLPKLCKGVCAGFYHLDWNHVDHNTNVMALIRDPVERTLSEFFFLRTDDGKHVSQQGQWNFNNNTWLEYVQNEPDVDDALEVYLNGYPLNPSINRQSMYLLGFDESKHAGEKYSWKENHEDLVERVKTHLDNTAVFGITDCYDTSMQVIANTLGWPVNTTLKLAKVHSRKHNKSYPSSFLKQHAPLTPLSPKTSLDTVDVKWRDVVGPKIIQRIQEQNAVDMELFTYARKRFGERFGMVC
jgi:hypothetical protein